MGPFAAAQPHRKPHVGGRLLSAPAVGSHIVQFYDEAAFLVDAVADYLEAGFRAGEPAIVVATPAHWDGIERALTIRGLDVTDLRASGALECLDAEQTLERMLVDDVPDAQRFDALVGELVRRVQSRAQDRRLRAYGEMVNVLWQSGRASAALALERLWNELSARSPFSLLCTYQLGGFGQEEDARAFHHVCDAHSHVLPTEQYALLDDSDARLREVTLLQQRARALESEIEQRKKVEAELRDALRVREDFLSLAGHELRTPLTPLALKLQMLRNDARNQPETPFVRRTVEHAEVCLRQVKRLTSLVNQVLDVARIEAGRFVISSEDVDLAELLRDVASRYHVQAATVGCELRVEIPPELPLRADRLRLEQVLSSLLDNACKYGRGRPIELRAVKDRDVAVVTVTDHGVGIPPEDLNRIFDRFERGVANRNLGGLGLGLFITRTVVEALGGAIQVTSQPSAGATFTVSLPLRRA